MDATAATADPVQQQGEDGTAIGFGRLGSRRSRMYILDDSVNMIWRSTALVFPMPFPLEDVRRGAAPVVLPVNWPEE